MRRFLTRFTLITGWGLLGISLAGFGAALFWILDLSNHFRVQYLAGGIAGIVAGMALRSKSAVLLFCCTAGINAIPLIPLFIPRTAPADTIREVSIVSYNTWRANSDWNSVAAVLREEDPDIAFFAETHPDIQAGIRRLETAFHLFEANTDFLLVRRTAGLNPRRIASGSEGMAGIPLALTVGKREVTLLAIHPAAPRSAATASEHDQLFAAVASFLKNRTGPCIVLGDFNATPWSRSFRLLQEHTGLVNSQTGFGIQTTWPAYPDSQFNWLLRIPIDHCLHSPEITTLSRRIGDPGRSNHHPVLLRLGFPSSPWPVARTSGAVLNPPASAGISPSE